MSFSTVAVAQWVRRWSSCCRVLQAEGSSTGADIHKLFSAMIFISVLLVLMDFSDFVILCSKPNGCCRGT